MSERSQEFDRAMDKVRDEMAGSKTSPEVAAVGEIVTAMLQARPGIAGAILGKGKTLDGAFKAMREYAEKNRKGSSSFAMGPATAQAVICGYYGFTVEEPVAVGMYAGAEGTGNRGQETGMAAEAQTLADVPEPVDPFDLDALMGGL